jgi:hypothetical protein
LGGAAAAGRMMVRSPVIWGLSRRAAVIMFSEPVSNRNRLNLPNYFAPNVWAAGRKGNSEHVEDEGFPAGAGCAPSAGFSTVGVWSLMRKTPVP